MRWQEQVTLTTYEMQWTVRYFKHNRDSWDIPSSAGTGTSGIDQVNSQSLSPGAVAYRARKRADWHDMMIKADSTFTKSNPAYQSPL